ncbi:MAG: helix-turn-helix transcriptional regulator [Alistipes sp.]|nr:helix-turn-helix transcriptional regulator [Alistipes sp.]
MLYRNIEEKCKKFGISVSALEKAVGLGNATIRGWGESSPKVDNLKKVADYFGCTVDDLVKGE